MKKILFLIILYTAFQSFGQEAITNKTEMCNTLKKMITNDRMYRGGEILDDKTFGKKSTYPQKVQDSVRKLQKKLDNTNTEKLIKLTKKYGWISDERIYCTKLNIWLIFRHSDRKYYKQILAVIEKEHKAKRLSDFYYKLMHDHVTGKY
ncbi:hypothetical protein [uncultured Kordia sp.]|uniref:hypothetical protein n=1 Tax=uncultured Kordia sp. TaxID=507699 RepID=UPI00260BCED3|nr:hypothetical protein [uncultured Kordia sp.]